MTATRDELDERRKSWSAYWASGALHSCAGSFEGNYAGPVRDFWQEWLAGVAADARVLDVATGNGALPALFLQLAPDARRRIDAVDLAHVQPAWLAEAPADVRARTTFHSGVSAEALPFDDGVFDGCASQFGLEYTDVPRSLAELRRVTRAGGRIGLVLHSDRSLIVERAREELRHLAWMLDESALLDVGTGLCDAFALAGTPDGARRLAGDATANALRANYNSLMSEADARVRGSPCPDAIDETRQAIAQVLMSCRASGSGHAGRSALADLAARLRESRLRLRELVDCALDEERVRGLLASADAHVERVVELRFDNGGIMAWGLAARFPD